MKTAEKILDECSCEFGEGYQDYYNIIIAMNRYADQFRQLNIKQSLPIDKLKNELVSFYYWKDNKYKPKSILEHSSIGDVINYYIETERGNVV